MSITAKVKCSSRVSVQDDLDVVWFAPDYADGANAEWAYATPALSIQMNVRPDVPFKAGAAYTLTFDEIEAS